MLLSSLSARRCVGDQGTRYKGLLPDNHCKGEPQLYLEGSIWLEYKFRILGAECFVKGQIKIRYDFFAKEISHKLELSGGCGPIKLTFEIELKWNPPNYPKIPKAAEFGVGAYLIIDECARICHPWASCGWRGCRSWEECHRICIKVSVGGKIGPVYIGPSKKDGSLEVSW